MKPITREKFILATGREPENDDLDRCNCPHAGQVTHQMCGWDEARDKPRFDLVWVENYLAQRVAEFNKDDAA